jgi:hypothetical protein
MRATGSNLNQASMRACAAISYGMNTFVYTRLLHSVRNDILYFFIAGDGRYSQSRVIAGDKQHSKQSVIARSAARRGNLISKKYISSFFKSQMLKCNPLGFLICNLENLSTELLHRFFRLCK